jgi:hypothetical protein
MAHRKRGFPLTLRSSKRIFALIGFAAVFALSQSVTLAQVLPNPVLYFKGTETFESGGKRYIRYNLGVTNAADYPPDIFVASPDLPPCGKNTRASRTWLDIYTLNGKRLYGFCALEKAADLGNIWFAIEEGTAPPNYVYIELWDRRTDTKHRSTTAEISATVSATDSRAKGAVAPPTRTLTRTESSTSETASKHYYALVIGNNTYKYVRSLKTAEEDAKAVDAVLRASFGFETRLLLNASRQDILSTISYYRRALDPNDSFLIYYAGHGYFDREADKAYWLPVDARTDDNSNWISADDITSNIRAVSAKHILVISDSCYSGTIYRGLEMGVEPLARERFLDKMNSGKSRTLMASGGNEPVADGGGGAHSVFANALIVGLNKMETEKFTASELFRDFVQERVAGGANQTPEYNPLRNSGHESGDFVFVRRK